jgi:hypothetical protein
MDMRKIIVVLTLSTVIFSCTNTSEAYVIAKIFDDDFSPFYVEGSPIKDVLNTSYKWGEAYNETKNRLPALDTPNLPEYRGTISTRFI